ncbi:MAG TPA: mechanosensitive ion channel family protein, partial [Gammaproteobacteria bacterium]
IFETIGLRYSDFEKIEAVVGDVRAMLTSHEGIAQDRTLLVCFDTYGESSLNFFIYAFTRTSAWDEYHRVKQDVLLKTGRIIESHGAGIAFPTRTLLLPEGLSVTTTDTSPERKS